MYSIEFQTHPDNPKCSAHFIAPRHQKWERSATWARSQMIDGSFCRVGKIRDDRTGLTLEESTEKS